jgi:hypothetical protein
MNIKSIYLILGMLFWLFSASNLQAQAPQAFPYQAVVRNANGAVIPNQLVSLRFSVLQGSSSGSVLYQEKHTLTSTSLGLCNVNIGEGTVLSGIFSSINWGNGAKYIKVELDTTGGNNFTVMGTTQLLSVPYAMYANVPGVAGPQGPQGIQGIQGLPGAVGANGKTILNGAVNPTAGQGVDGDFYLNTTTKQLFGPKAGGLWGSGTSLVGPQGATGATGLQGATGATGSQGATGATGPQGLAGANGSNGNTVLHGVVDPVSGDGMDGDFYLNTSTMEIFGPKTAGTWNTGTSLVGPQGPAGSGLAPASGIGNTTYWNGTEWEVNSNFLYNDGTSLGIGNPSPDPSAIVDITSYSKGLLIPRMSTYERDAILSPAIGLHIFNTDDHCTDIFDGTNWMKSCGMKVTGTVTDPNHTTPDTWAQKADILNSRSGAVAFTIGNKSYVGLGTFMGMTYYDDFYEYDHATNSWTQKANFPPGARANAIAFSIGGKGYVTTGGNGSFVNYDMWEYDPTLDTWTQKTSLPGSARWKAQGYAVGAKAYLGLGTDGSSDLNDWWEYDPTVDSWIQQANYPGSGRLHTMGFTANTYGYVGLGTDVNNNYYNDVWEFDPPANTWLAKQVFPGIAFHSMACFSMNNKGYMGTGTNGATDMTDFWEYDAISDTWTSKATFAGSARKNAVGFSYGKKGFIATGMSGFSPNLDLWEYMDDNVSGNSYSNNSVNTQNNSLNDGAWTIHNNQVYNSNSGNIGIGTSTPTSKLTVNGNVDIAGEILTGGVLGTAGQVLSSNGNGTMSWITNAGGGGSSPWTTAGNDIANTNTGGVGIGGMPSLNAKLYVHGSGGYFGNTFSDLTPNSGVLNIRSQSSSFSSFVQYMKFDGQRIQSVSHNAFIFPSPAPTATNLYLNPLGGNVGIRMSTAAASLSVARGTGVDGTAAFIGTNHVSHFNYSTAEDTYIRGGKDGSKVIINDGALGPVVIGNVSSTPAGYKLFVKDGILTERLKVAVHGTGNWADYVFADDYSLMPLEQVEAFIKEHKHLPHVPSAQDMVTEGIDVATVDAKLMEKIEELTLYIIALKKEMNTLKEEQQRITSSTKKD